MLNVLKALHVLAAVLFLGNVVVTGVWSWVLFRQRARVDFRITAQAIVVTDWIFTFGGAAVLVTTGVGLAIGREIAIWDTFWLRQAILGLAISTALWLVVLVPTQRAMLRLAPTDDSKIRRLYWRWNVTGWIAVVPILWSLWCMTTKPV